MRRTMRLKWLWALAIVLALTLMVTGGALAVGRSGPLLHRSEYRCLIFDGGTANGTILDLRNLLSRRDPRPRAGAVPTRFGQDSPDGKYRAYLEWNNRPDTTNTLYVYPSQGGVITVQSDIVAPFQFHWSPDGQHMAYIWTKAQRGYLTVAAADGRDLRTVELLGTDVYEVYLHGWSPDGRYLLMSNRVGGERRFELWAMDTLTAHEFPVYAWVGEPSWSPNGRYLLYRLDLRHAASMNAESAVSLSVVDLQTFVEKQYALGSQPDSLRLEWSADGTWLFAQYFNPFPRLQVDVFGIDGREYRAVTFTDIPGLFSDQGVAHWLRGTSKLVHIHQQGVDSTVSLRVFDPATGGRTQIVDDMPRRYAPSPTDPNRIAVVEREGNLVRGVVMNADGTDRQTVFEGESDFGDPDWSPDGQWVAFTWAQSNGFIRIVNLSWMKADGSGKQTLSDFGDVKELRWLPNNTLAFVGMPKDSGYFEPYIAELSTATLRGAGTQLWLRDVWQVDVEPTQQLYRIWWQQWNGTLGMTGIDAAGKVRQHFRLGEPLENREALRVEFAPDGATAAVKLGYQRRNEMLQLAKADGSWSPVVVSDLKGLGDPVWSPDSKLVAFTFAPNMMGAHSPLKLGVYTADGQHVRTVEGKSSWYGNLAWTRCD